MSADISLPASAGERIDELLAKALRPVAVEVRVDPVTLDRLFILHFEEHEPTHIVVGACDLAVILADLTAAITQSLN